MLKRQLKSPCLPCWFRSLQHGCIASLFLLASSSAHAQGSLDCLIEPYLLVDVSSSEIGVIGSVNVREADLVKQGDVIASLRTGVEQAVLELSRARAEAAAEIALLRRDYEFNTRQRTRIDKLHNQQVVSAQNLDEARTAEDLARLRLRAAAEKQRTVQLEAARDALALERRTVRSPIDGVVVQRYKSAGEYVDGVPIIQLAQLDPLRVEIVAPISMFGRISVGMQATVLPELQMDEEFVASVTSIDPIMDAATATFGVRLSLPNPGHRLPPGLKCTLVLHPERKRLAEVDVAPPTQPSQSMPSPQTEPAPPAARTIADIAHDAAAGSIPKPSPAAATVVASPVSISRELRSHDELCATLGPVRGKSKADEIAARLSANEVSFARRYDDSNKVRTPWIVLSRDAHPTPAELIARLKRAGVSDFQALTRGAWKHRVSYGRYRGEQHARRRLQQMKKLGFDAELVHRTHGKSNIWLDLAHSPADPVLSPVIAAVRDENPALALQSIPCTPLASR